VITHSEYLILKESSVIKGKGTDFMFVFSIINKYKQKKKISYQQVTKQLVIEYEQALIIKKIQEL